MASFSSWALVLRQPFARPERALALSVLCRPVPEHLSPVLIDQMSQDLSPEGFVRIESTRYGSLFRQHIRFSFSLARRGRVC